MRHPWATRRERANYTQEAVAELLNVNRQTIIRLEQGLFHQPSEYILKDLGDIYAAPIGELIEEYNEYVKTQRHVFALDYQDFGMVLRGYTGLIHPLVFYRWDTNSLTRLKFCRELCLDYAPVADYEKNKQRAVPEGIKKACEDMGWDWAYLENAVAEWRVRGHADKT